MTNSAHIRIMDLDNSVFKNGLLYESYNAGKTWTTQNLSIIGGWSGSDELWGSSFSYQGLLQTIGYNPDVPNTVLWVTTQFLYRSTDGGKMWNFDSSQKVGEKWRSKGIDNVVPIVVEPSRVNSSLVYVGYLDMGLWRSDDNGISWKSLNVAKYSGNWYTAVGGNTLTVIADPTRAEVVWAQMAGDLEECETPCEQPLYLVKSINRGDTWTNLKQGLPSTIRRLDGLVFLNPLSTSVRHLVAVVNGDIYKSIDDGTTWKMSLACNWCTRTFRTTSGSIFAFSSNRSIYRSIDSARTWSKLTLPTRMISNWTIGLHWLHDTYKYIGPFDLASKSNGRLWLAVFGIGKGVYHSSDNGQSWKKVLVDNFARAVEVDPVSGEVYAGSSIALIGGGYVVDSHGVRFSTDGISNWRKRNEGITYPFATAISISRWGTKWLISPGQGVLIWS
jgi:hypothetical protein